MGLHAVLGNSKTLQSRIAAILKPLFWGGSLGPTGLALVARWGHVGASGAHWVSLVAQFGPLAQVPWAQLGPLAQVPLGSGKAPWAQFGTWAQVPWAQAPRAQAPWAKAQKPSFSLAK